jgi:hypothetical protein
VALTAPTGHWPPSQIESCGCLRHPYCRFPGWLVPFEGRSSAVARAGYLVLLRRVVRSSNGRSITGTFSIAIDVPFETILVVNRLRWFEAAFVWILETKRRKVFKKMEAKRKGGRYSALALGTKMRSATGQKNSPNRGLTPTAGLSGSLVNAVLELKETTFSVRAHVVGDRGAA